MKNKSYYILILFIFIYSLYGDAISDDQFDFDITEVEILENGNLYKGLKRGTIKTNDGSVIDADTFEYDKTTNILHAKGNVKIEDTIKNYIIFADDVTYYRNDERVITSGNSKGFDMSGQIITANKFDYNKLTNTLNAKGNVKIEDTIKNYIIFAEDITHLRNKKKILTKGETQSNIQDKYNIKSKDVIYFEESQKLTSKNKTTVKDKNSKIYYLDKFTYLIEKEELKGENVIVISNFDKPNSDKFYFSNAIINFKKKTLIGKDTKIEVQKDIFGDKNNDPRLYGSSSISKNNKTIIKKGVFTSCKKNDSCPPWSIQADEIIHDKNKKRLSYNNALLKIYDMPVLYLPKFFHPDPSVKRQSGLLQPKINNSNVLGSSLNVPYYHVFSDNKDFTFSPTFFDGDVDMFEGEYRQENKYSSMIVDFGITTNFKSSYSNKKKNITHLFSKFNYDLNLENFNDSKFNLYLEKMSKDTFLKVFEDNLLINDVRPDDYSVLSSGLDFSLNSDSYSFKTGLISYENLNKKNSDRYQFVLPYYDYSSRVYSNRYGTVDFFSNGNNILQNTNNLRTKVINNVNLISDDYINSKFGLKNNLNIYFKNVNTVAKEDVTYKSSPQSELMNIVEMNTSIPNIKKTQKNTQLLTPKVSFRFNPGDMKNHYNADRRIDASTIFNIERLGLGDSFESGKSLTFGVDYSNKNNLNNTTYGAKIATVYRANEKNTIPKKTTINKKKSYLFGEFNFKNSNFLDLNYNFAIDENFEEIKYHGLEMDFSINNFVTNFNFIEEDGIIGSRHIVENKSTYQFNEQNFISFKTRRNKQINLTEYYDIIYEYKNDCLVAGIKFNKKYYEDRDLKPSENLFFSITLLPITNYEYEIDKSVYNQSFWKRD